MVSTEDDEEQEEEEEEHCTEEKKRTKGKIEPPELQRENSESQRTIFQRRQVTAPARPRRDPPRRSDFAGR